MLVLKLILGLVVFLVLLYFTNLNIQDVRLYYGREAFVEAPLFLVLLVSLIAGMGAALLIGLYEKLKLKAEIRRLRKDKKRVESELASLRKMPIVDSAGSGTLPEGGGREGGGAP